MNTIKVTEILENDSVSGSRITINENFKTLANSVNDLLKFYDTSTKTIQANTIELDAGDFAIKTGKTRTTRFKITNNGDVYIGTVSLNDYILDVVNSVNRINFSGYDKDYYQDCFYNLSNHIMEISGDIPWIGKRGYGEFEGGNFMCVKFTPNNSYDESKTLYPDAKIRIVYSVKKGEDEIVIKDEEILNLWNLNDEDSSDGLEGGKYDATWVNGTDDIYDYLKVFLPIDKNNYPSKMIRTIQIIWLPDGGLVDNYKIYGTNINLLEENNNVE